MKHLLLFTLAIVMTAFQSTEQMVTTKPSLLNGTWEGGCAKVLTGEFKGEIECPVMEPEPGEFTIISLNEKNEGVWIFHRDAYRSDTTKAKLITRGKVSILQMERSGEKWEREILSVTQDSLKVYTKSKEYLDLFRRKK